MSYFKKGESSEVLCDSQTKFKNNKDPASLANVFCLVT